MRILGEIGTATVPNVIDRQAAHLCAAQERALALFDEVVAAGILTPGTDETQASDAIRELARTEFGVERYWHKRIVRAGSNTLLPYRENPPVCTIAADDICFVDFGPVFGEWEADVGRTFVLGSDPAKIAIRDAVERVWTHARARIIGTPGITAQQVYALTCTLIREAGYEPGEVRHVGHLVGEFPHERIDGDRVSAYLCADNDLPIERRRPDGEPWHWILEIHAVDRDRGFGAFIEQLLTC